MVWLIIQVILLIVPTHRPKAITHQHLPIIIRQVREAVERFT